MVKEHLVCLSLNKKLVEQLDRIPTQTKSAFTRAYNKSHSKGFTKSGKGGKGTAQGIDSSDDENDSDSDGGDIIDARMLDEEQIKEMKKAKAAEKDLKKQMK